MDPAQLYLHTSNRLDQLARNLVAVSRQQPLSSPLESEQIMVQNAGIARWLRFEIAKIDGVAMNWEFPFAAKVLSAIASTLLPDFETVEQYDPDIARWRLFNQLENTRRSRVFEIVTQYIDGDEKKRLKFATQLSRLFDEYLVYRPDIILRWEDGKESPAWMREIWKNLSRSLFEAKDHPLHLPRLWKNLIENPAAIKQTTNLPSRLFVFGFSALPPLQLDIFKALSHQIPVHVFLLQPTNLYWSDLRAHKQERAARRKRKIEYGKQTPHDAGNPLLPAWGKQSQEFLNALIDRDPIQLDDGFIEPVSDSQLHTLQNDLFNLVDRNAAESKQPEFQFEEPLDDFPSQDSSIQIHACHSETRECETLRDFLLQCFHDIEDLRPGEILVMAPEIEQYRHAIDTVFQADSNSKKFIPYSISDNHSSRESNVYQTYLALFKLPRARLSAEEMLDTLSLPLIRKKYSFSERDLESIESWIRSIGTTWGWDAAQRQTLGGYPAASNTWKEFIDRLSLGLAMGTEEDLWQDLLPFIHLEGESASLAGRLIAFFELVRSLVTECEKSKTVNDWNSFIFDRTLLFESILDEYEKIDYAQISERIAKILPQNENAIISGNEIYALLIDELDRESPRSSLFNGKTSFCSLKPMRSVPARIICILGLNGEQFPRIQRRPTFDIINFNTRPCDRSRKDEDKQLFLEAVLSAQDRLFLSYQSASLSSEDIRQPSSVLQDLIDYLCAAENKTDAERVFQHPRISYDRSYFEETPSRFTYSRERARLNNLARNSRLSALSPAKGHPQFETSASADSLDLAEVVAFFKHPQRAFIQRTLNARYAGEDDALPDADFLALPPLDRYQLRDYARQNLMQESQYFFNKELIAAYKLLPPGYASDLQYQELKDELEQLRKRIEAAAGGTQNESEEIVRIGNYQIEGITRFSPTGDQIVVEAGKLNANRYLENWIRHLFAICLKDGAQTIVFSVAEPEKEIRYNTESTLNTELERLLATMITGLEKPIPLFPELSFNYAKHIHKTGNDDQETRRGAWQKISGRFSESYRPSPNIPLFWDPYRSACFEPGNIEPDEFHELAVGIFLPMIQASRDPIEAR